MTPPPWRRSGTTVLLDGGRRGPLVAVPASRVGPRQPGRGRRAAEARRPGGRAVPLSPLRARRAGQEAHLRVRRDAVRPTGRSGCSRCPTAARSTNGWYDYACLGRGERPLRVSDDLDYAGESETTTWRYRGRGRPLPRRRARARRGRGARLLLRLRPEDPPRDHVGRRRLGLRPPPADAPQPARRAAGRRRREPAAGDRARRQAPHAVHGGLAGRARRHDRVLDRGRRRALRAAGRRAVRGAGRRVRPGGLLRPQRLRAAPGHDGAPRPARARGAAREAGSSPAASPAGRRSSCPRTPPRSRSRTSAGCSASTPARTPAWCSTRASASWPPRSRSTAAGRTRCSTTARSCGSTTACSPAQLGAVEDTKLADDATALASTGMTVYWTQEGAARSWRAAPHAPAAYGWVVDNVYVSVLL